MRISVADSNLGMSPTIHTQDWFENDTFTKTEMLTFLRWLVKLRIKIAWGKVLEVFLTEFVFRKAEIFRENRKVLKCVSIYLYVRDKLVIDDIGDWRYWMIYFIRIVNDRTNIYLMKNFPNLKFLIRYHHLIKNHLIKKP